MKDHTNTTNVTWNFHTLDKNKTNATNVTFHLLRGVIWKDIWKVTLGKNAEVQPLRVFNCLGKGFEETFKISLSSKVKKPSRFDAASKCKTNTEEIFFEYTTTGHHHHFLPPRNVIWVKRGANINKHMRRPSIVLTKRKFLKLSLVSPCKQRLFHGH